MNDQKIEQEIQAKGLTAPRVTPADIEAAIASEHYFTALDGATSALATEVPKGFVPVSLGQLTICVLVLKNGFTVTGESACASPANFDAQIGRDVARQNAVQKIWALEGYLLKQRLFEQQQTKQPTHIQLGAMELYLEVLKERIKAFGKVEG